MQTITQGAETAEQRREARHQARLQHVVHVRAKQGAARHSVSLSHFWALIAAGKISPPLKLGPKISLFPVDVLDREFEALLANKT